MKLFRLLLVVPLLSACASIASGTSQDIVIDTNPSGAECVLEREGMKIAETGKTPATVTVERTKHDLTIVCNKSGYAESKFINHSGSEGFTAGNLILGGVIGWGIDSATGADNKYATPIIINLSRK